MVNIDLLGNLNLHGETKNRFFICFSDLTLKIYA